MKKLVLLICFTFISSLGYSQLFVENFDYPVGTQISTTPVWEPASGAGSNAITVFAPGLNFPNYAGSGIGNNVILNATGEDDSASVPRQTSGSVYASFMLRVNQVTTTEDYFFALSSTTNNFDARVYLRSSGTGFNLGITKANEVIINWDTTSYTFGVTYLIVDKYTFNPGVGDDQVSLFVFDPFAPVPATEPTPTIGPITAGSSDAANISRIILRQGATATAQILAIDGIYFDNTWNNNTLPVELASFTSSVSGRNVDLKWSTASELNNNGFEVERAINGVWSKVGFVNGNGTTNDAHNYSFTDRNLASGSYSYRLKQVDFNGNFEYHNLNNEVIVGIPSKFELSQNYPNPFNPSTTINYDVPFDSKVSLTIFDMSGKEISMIVNEAKTAGYYSVNFNAASLSSGIYFYTLQAGDFVSTKKMILVK